MPNTQNTKQQPGATPALRAQRAVRRMLAQLKQERAALARELARDRQRARWLQEAW